MPGAHVKDGLTSVKEWPHEQGEVLHAGTEGLRREGAMLYSVPSLIPRRLMRKVVA